MATLARAARNGKRYLNPVPTTIGGFSLIARVFVEYLTNREERVPREPLGPFQTDARIFASRPASGLRVTWLGHSSSLVELGGLRILIDPMWDERAAPVSWAGPRRFFPPPLPIESLPPIDLVLISHDHYDHLGAVTVRALSTAAATRQARWVTCLGVGRLLEDFGVARTSIQELDWTERTEVGSLEVTALPARHFSGRSFSNRFQTLWASFVLRAGSQRVFFGADSGEWEGFAEVGRLYGPFDLIMLEIGAFNDLWRDIHMGPDGALRTFQLLSGSEAHPGLLMPIHWGLFDLALHGWRQPIERLYAGAGGVKLWCPEPGRPEEVIAGQPLHSDWWRNYSAKR